MPKHTTIKVSIATRRKLEKAKIIPDETLENVILRLLDYTNKELEIMQKNQGRIEETS